MSPTSEELELGAKAYQQVRVYEKYTQRNFRQARWLFAGSLVVFVGIAFLIHHTRHEWPQSSIMLVIFPVCFGIHLAQNRTAKALYSSNKLVLHLLQEKYGDTLPWLVEEKEMALANELEKDMARQQQAPNPV